MGSPMVSTAALLLPFMLALIFEASSVLSQDLRETDAVCKANGCFVVYFLRKTFLDAWRACNEGGGNLATVKHREDAASIASLFSTLDLRYSRTQVQVWIGLQRQPRQCSTAHVLRGFSWTTGDQDTEFTNWLKEDSQSLCSVPRCAAVGYSTQESKDNLKWLDGPCSVPVDGYLCHYAYKEMCPALQREGTANILYSTPFNLQSSLLTHVPSGSVATVSCPSGSEEKQAVLCAVKENGSVGWSSESPICSSYNACDLNNGGCEHLCRMEATYFFCECDKGFQLRDDGQSCELLDVCQGDPCEYECLPLSDGHRCACPEGYMLAPDERSCLDVDECLDSPCEQVCVNTPGTFECQFLEGYHTDEDDMGEDVEEYKCINDPCEHACEDTPGSFVCHCHLGFSPVPEDHTRCQDIDECQVLGTCQQMCVNYEGGFECYCREGYELMSDNYACRKIEEGDDAVDYDWNLPQSPTDWPLEEDQTVDWLTRTPRARNPDVIWVTRASQEHDLPTPGAPHDMDDIGAAWQISQFALEGLEDVVYTTPPPTSSSFTSDLYEEDKEETATTLPFTSTSTASEGAWNWWSQLTTQKPDQTVSALVSTDSTNRSEEEIKAHIPVEDLGEEENHSTAITRPQYPAPPTQSTASPASPTRSAASPSPLSEAGDSGDEVNPVQDDRQQKQTWLLVGLLVPVCIILVVMVALGIVYCTRCTVQPRSSNATDCYHWISGAHDKQGAANPSAGVKAHV